MQPKLYPRLTLALLTGLNILNYIDRNVLIPVQDLVKNEFHISDLELGTLASVFFFTYMFAAPIVGWMGDRFSRKALVSTPNWKSVVRNSSFTSGCTARSTFLSM